MTPRKPERTAPHRMPRRLGRFALAALLGVLTLLASFGLLSLSGGFITAAAIAGASTASAIAFDIFRPGAIIRLFAIVRTAGRYGERLASHDAVLHRLADLRVQAFSRLTLLAPEPLTRYRDGDLLQRMVSDIDALDEAPLRAWLPSLQAHAVVLAALCLITLAEPALAWIAAPGLLAALWLAPWWFARYARRAGERLAHQAALRRERLIDLLRGLTTLRLSGALPAWRNAWNALDRDTIDAQFRLRLREALAQAGVVLLVGLTAWGVLAAGHRPLIDGSLSGPWLAAASLAALATLEALAPQAGALIALSRSRAARHRVDALLDQPVAVHFPASGPQPAARGELEMADVQFRYPSRDAGVSVSRLHVHAGERIVLEGPSGGGKSTLLALMARSLDPDAGRISLDGVDLRAYDEASLRQRVAVLPQRPHLFAGSLRDNLRLGDPTADDTRLRAALSAVALEHFLDQLPQGLDTLLGEYGHGLSGGEARRVALATVLLRDARLVLLDEAFEGLDAATAAQVASGIDAWIGDATLIVVSHRPLRFSSTVRRLYLRSGVLAP